MKPHGIKALAEALVGCKVEQAGSRARNRQLTADTHFWPGLPLVVRPA